MAYQVHSETKIGRVHLTVTDLARSIAFYTERLGLHVFDRNDDGTLLGVDKRVLLALTENLYARPPGRTTGLFHFAILVPTRRDLAHALRRLVEKGTLLQGFADHRVSEAIYLADPDGNGIEIYRDRPRDEWEFRGEEVVMATDPLDVDGLLAEADGPPSLEIPQGTVMGHVHLKVRDIPQAEAFNSGLLGFALMARYGDRASFVSAGGYHHHVGLNTWSSAGAPPPPENSTGLRHFEILSPEPDVLAGRLRDARVVVDETLGGYLARDPSQNSILISAL
ncbi:MAG: VOC family protein [Fimbriimonadales bacterium]